MEKRRAATVGFDARTVGERLFVPGYWYAEDFSSRRTSAVLVIDTATDQVTRLAEDSRCPGYVLVPLPSGDLHMLPDGYFAQEFYLDVAEPREACARCASWPAKKRSTPTMS